VVLTSQNTNRGPIVAGPVVSLGEPSPSVGHRLEPVQVAELSGAYLAGATMGQLAEHYRLDHVTVLRHLERQGVPRRQPRRLQPDEVNETVRLYAERMSVRSVAEKLATGQTTVRRTLRKAGVEMQPRGRMKRSP
jgi:transposase-like protein